ncbi:MAG: multidrug effflux MFS transporter, partial [Alphaproteobacteria bacterium]|nr:multidrug effflux MFS transporter [Alphaproteobacteria bacterium]
MHPIPQTLAGQEPVPRMSWLIVALGVITAIGPLSIDMYLPAFNDISESLGSDMVHVQYSLTTYFIGLSLGQLFYGPIADRFGRKRPLQFGMCLYIAASIGCAFATNIETLVFMRCLQALGAAAGAVITRAMVRDRFSPNHAARVFSLLIMIMGVAPILAPLLGGFITVHFGWRAIFWFLVFVSTSCFIVSLRLPETREPHLRLKSLSFTSVMVTYGKIIRNRHFLGYSLISAMAMAGMFTYITSSPFVLMVLNGIDKKHFGWFFGANALGFVIASQFNARVLTKISYNKVLLLATAAQFLCGIIMLLSQ